MARPNPQRVDSGLYETLEFKEPVELQARFSSGGPDGASEGLSDRHTALAAIVLFVLVVVAFLPAFRNGFVNFDDDVYVLDNLHVTSGLTWPNIQWAFSNLEAGFWHPLTWLSILADYQLYGLEAWGHHLTSVSLHGATTVVLFVALQRMTRATWRSAFVSALFGLHPLHVESVAWVSERKDVLSGLFWMLSLLMYIYYAQPNKSPSPRSADASGKSLFHPPSSLYYLLSLAFFLGGLMSKPMIVTLPLMLLLLDWWPLGRMESGTPGARGKHILALIWEKVPFLAAAFALGVATICAEKGIGALGSATRFPFAWRVENALLSYLSYLKKTIWPSGLAVFYPYPDVFPAWRVAGASLLGILISVLVLRESRKRPYLTVGWFWYVVTLLPVIGLIQVGDFSQADRFTYLPLIGIFVALTWSAYDLTRRWQYQVVALGLAGSAAIMSCWALTWQQLRHWQDSESLFRHALAVTEHNGMAHEKLGEALAAKGQVDEAIRQLREAVRLSPAVAQTHYNLGTQLALLGQVTEAIPQFQEAIRLKPNYDRAHNNLGTALLELGQIDEAIRHFQETLRLKPDYPQANNSLAHALEMKNRPANR